MGNKGRPTAINLGNAKVGTLKIDDVTVMGDMDGIVADSPEIGQASIENYRHIVDSSLLSSEDLGLLLHFLNISQKEDEGLRADVATLKAALENGVEDAGVFKKACKTIRDFASKVGNTMLEKLVDKTVDALLGDM